MIIDNEANNPAITHTKVETVLGLIPDSRERSGLLADADTDLPNEVRFMNQPSRRASTGTAMRMMSCGPRTRISVNQTSSHTEPTTTGYFWPAASMSGSWEITSWASCAIPTVATSTITRGELNSRRITVSSTAAANKTPSTSESANANQNPQP